MFRTYLGATIFAGLMIIFAVMARVGLADRQTVEILLLITPLITVMQISGHRAGCDRVGEKG